MLAKDGEQGWLSRLHKRYRKAVGEYKNMENDIYSNDSPNDDLESTFWKSSWSALSSKRKHIYTNFAKALIKLLINKFCYQYF